MNNDKKNVTVLVNNKEYKVEIKDISARPIIAVVNGKEYTVQVETGGQKVSIIPEMPQGKPKGETRIKQTQTTQTPSMASLRGITAPLPGDVVEILVKPGDKVKAGQVICVLEAMKMRNSVRTPRDGKIASVDISVGQSVGHGVVLVSFE